MATTILDAGGFKRKADAQTVWYQTLESIRRPTPLHQGETVTLETESPTPHGADPTTGAGAPVHLEQVRIPIDDDDDGSGSGPPRPDSDGRDSAAFYGLAGRSQEDVDAVLQYHLRGSQVGRYPSPAAGLRFDVTLLRQDLGDRRGISDDEVRYQRFLGGGGDSAPRLLGVALERWLEDRVEGSASLIRGFPLMEDVVFFRAANHRGSPSNCYWKAMAYQMYGHYSYDIRVKAEHHEYFSEVLRRPEHPRHALYTRINQRFYEVDVDPGDGMKKTRILANFYQILSIPNAWTPAVMFDITADLYNLFIVLYTLRQPDKSQPRMGCTEVAAMGSTNNRHIFMLYVDGNHFQPMIPNEYYASEFRMPPITYESTIGYPFAGDKNKERLAFKHSWRACMHFKGTDTMSGPPPVNRAVAKNTLITAKTGLQ